MIDIKFIRNNSNMVRQALKQRNYEFDLDHFLDVEGRKRKLQVEIEQIAARQNTLDKEIQHLLRSKKDPKPKIEESKEIKKASVTLRETYAALENEYSALIDRIPNIPDASLPVGGAAANTIIKYEGSKRKFSFTPQPHMVLAEKLDIIDFNRAAKISGSNFVLFKNEGALLERALINFMLDTHTRKHGYTEILPPKLVSPASMRATGQLPNLRDDMYELSADNLFLIPTAEVPVTNMHRDEIIPESDLPLKYVAYTPCFRREAGSYGKDTKGLVRVHEFDKIEMVKFVRPEESYTELDSLLADACSILKMLHIPYRIVLLATGDISFAAAKCFDIELYAPGTDMWLEVSSCSNFTDFQARRGNIRYKDKTTGRNEYLHTLNGSGVALARLVIAILENYQEKNGSITIPKVLRTYCHGKKRIQK